MHQIHFNDYMLMCSCTFMETTVIYQFSFNKYESTRSSQDEFILKHPYKFIHCIVAFNDEFEEFSNEFNVEFIIEMNQI